MARDRGDSKNRIYPLSINTRNAREICSKSELIFGQQKQQPQKRFPRKTLTGFSTDFVKNKNRLAGGWPHCVTPTTIPSVFFPCRRQSQNRNPGGAPAIFCLTSSGTVSGTPNFFFACREALAGCRVAALTLSTTCPGHVKKTSARFWSSR